MNEETLNSIWEKGLGLAMEYGPRILLALIVLIVGMRLIKVVVNIARKGMSKSKVDETLRPFLSNLLNWTLKAVLIISVLGMFGVETTSFVAILGAAGLAVGLALQGTLANFAGGVLLLIFKPYKVGDLVQAQGELGVVKEIQIFNTVLINPENKRIIIPNGAISNGHITNFTAEGKIRVDLTVGISYNADIRQAKTVLTAMMKQDEKVLAEPAPSVSVSELGDNSVNLAVRPWCKPEDFWDVYFGTLENAKYALDDANISIPFPQVDVHMIPA